VLDQTSFAKTRAVKERTLFARWSQTATSVGEWVGDESATNNTQAKAGGSASRASCFDCPAIRKNTASVMPACHAGQQPLS
jgi:hypothetical protein